MSVVKTAKQYAVVVNPQGGTRRGLAVLRKVKPVFAAAGAQLDVHVTKHAGHAAEMAQTMDLHGCDGICLIGGDGTIHEVVSGLMQRSESVTTPVGIIPGGTGNSLLCHLGCSEPVEAAQRIVAGNIRPLDVARVTMKDDVAYCVNIVGWGAAVDINRTAERLRVLGPPRYAMAALWYILRAQQRPARLVLDERVVEDEFLFILACNTRFTGKGMLVAPAAEIDDGKIDVVVVRHATRLQMLELFRKQSDGSHVSLPFVEYHQVRSFAIESDRRDLLNLDGELKGNTPASAEMIPAALRLFV